MTQQSSKGLAILAILACIVALVSIIGWTTKAASVNPIIDQLNSVKADLSEAKADLATANAKTCPVCPVCPAEKICPTATETNPVQTGAIVDLSAVKQKAVDDFMAQYKDDENFVCDGDEYDFNQIAVSSISKEWTFNQINKDEYQIDTVVKLKFSDKDVEAKCYQTYEVSVFYPKDKDADLDIDYAIA